MNDSQIMRMPIQNIEWTMVNFEVDSFFITKRFPFSFFFWIKYPVKKRLEIKNPMHSQVVIVIYPVTVLWWEDSSKRQSAPNEMTCQLIKYWWLFKTKYKQKFIQFRWLKQQDRNVELSSKQQDMANFRYWSRHVSKLSRQYPTNFIPAVEAITNSKQTCTESTVKRKRRRE